MSGRSTAEEKGKGPVPLDAAAAQKEKDKERRAALQALIEADDEVYPIDDRRLVSAGTLQRRVLLWWLAHARAGQQAR